MSKYTTQLKTICESLAGRGTAGGYNDLTEIINTARPLIFSFDYPIFDVNHKPTLETKIIKHYLMREIGFETYGLWKFYLDTRMNEIMPYYNPLYESARLDFNILEDTDYTRTLSRLNQGESSGVSSAAHDDTIQNQQSGTENNWDLYQNTPSGGITGVRDENYLTDARHHDLSHSGTGENHSTGSRQEQNSNNMHSNESVTERIHGKRGMENYASLIKQYREIIINIDRKVINDLNDLFMNIW